ncbi:MAG: 2-C-methyl-D-erythritol 4-phosphate cytidylyltransferase [Actinomycetota bacterium]|nr:2-C-methyl-D-erythritol 4-phosphate cytidylyltransferase [Actinomycetota bacterium]
MVPVEARGSLPFSLVHHESLVAAASSALAAAGAELVGYDTALADVRRSGRSLVLHDPLCPLTPAAFLAEAAAESATTRAVVAGVRPVTDTIKEYDGSHLGRTLDRGTLVQIVSPIVLPVAVVAALGALVTDDFAELVDRLRTAWPLRLVPAPALARRVDSAADLAILEALSATAC